MTQEEKRLLLQDLCARLPYGVIVYIKRSWKTETIDYICASEQKVWLNDADNMVDISGIQPFLRPMSSMTEEEKNAFWCLNHNPNTGVDFMTHAPELIDWLNAHHFDYRGLIEKGLALEAIEGMYNLEKK